MRQGDLKRPCQVKVRPCQMQEYKESRPNPDGFGTETRTDSFENLERGGDMKSQTDQIRAEGSRLMK
jgi:hypothetical protein